MALIEAMVDPTPMAGAASCGIWPARLAGEGRAFALRLGAAVYGRAHEAYRAIEVLAESSQSES